jgi:hypothetical protein
MPRLRINLRDLNDIEELEELAELEALQELDEPAERDRPERREVNPLALERRREGRRRGREITRHLRQVDKLRGR